MFLFLQGNRSAKLKQSKLDVRREQWLSQGLISRAPYLFFFFFVFPIMFDFGCCWVGPGDLGVWGGGGELGSWVSICPQIRFIVLVESA